jgi:hypothetical protein
MLDDDWVVRVDGRGSDALLDALRSPLGEALLAPCRRAPDVWSLGLRRAPGGATTATLLAGPASVARLTEAAGAVQLDLAGAPGAWRSLEDAQAERPALLARIARAEPVLGVADRAAALLANGADPALAPVARRLVPAYRDDDLRAALRTEAGAPLRRLLPGGDTAGFGDAPDLLAVDERGRLTVVEVTEPDAAGAALVRARFWADVLGQWLGDDALGRIRLCDAMAQRTALGLAAPTGCEPTAPLRIVPAVAVAGVRAGTPSRHDPLVGLAGLVDGLPTRHPAVQRCERWVLDADGRRAGAGCAAA